MNEQASKLFCKDSNTTTSVLPLYSTLEERIAQYSHGYIYPYRDGMEGKAISKGDFGGQGKDGVSE